MRVNFLPLGPEAQIPTKSNPLDAGVDLFACLPSGDMTLKPSVPTKIPTGVAMSVDPDKGHVPVAYIADRSSMGAKGVHRLGGVVDSATYRGEISVVLINLTESDIVVKHGDRIAQMLIWQLPQVEIQEVGALDSTLRGTLGFGEFTKTLK